MWQGAKTKDLSALRNLSLAVLTSSLANVGCRSGRNTSAAPACRLLRREPCKATQKDITAPRVGDATS
jgi:hypothetical protein